MDLKKPQLRIDSQRAVSGGGASPVESGGTGGAPSLPRPPAPTGLALVAPASLVQSTVSPQAVIELSWIAPRGVGLAGYVIQWSTDATFTTGVNRDPAGPDRERTTIGRLPVSTATSTVTVYFRICSVAKGGLEGTFSPAISAVMPSDTTPPDPPSAVSASFAVDGTLEVRATPPTSRNFKHIRIEIWNGANVTQLEVSQFGGGLWTWSPTRNRERTALAGGGGATTSVTVRLYAVSWGGVDSTLVTVTAVSNPPVAPTGLNHSWANDAGGPTAGRAAADLLVTHAVLSGLSYALSIDGVERQITPGRYPYPWTQNAAEHAGTADPSLTLSLVAENGLGQRSPAATATAVNAAPPPATAAAFGGFSSLTVTITRPSPPPADFAFHRLRVYRNSGVIQTLETVEDLLSVRADGLGSGSYQVDVIEVDVFGQASAPSALSAAATLTDDAAFAAALKSGARYRDTKNGNPDTLKAQLANGIRASGGIAYS